MEGKWPQVRYFGCLREKQRDVLAQLEEKVYNNWDSSAESPPRQRPRPAASVPNLSLLLWANGNPSFPPSVVDKFNTGSDQHREILRLKAELEQLWPAPSRANTPPSAPGGTTVRAVGAPDLTNANVLDVQRQVDLLKIPGESFTEEKFLNLDLSAVPCAIFSPCYTGVSNLNSVSHFSG